MKYKGNWERGMVLVALALSFIMLSSFVLSQPEGASSIQSIANETNTPQSGALLNTSGGEISTININASSQNIRWKAYVGNVTGTLTLQDSSNTAIFDWSLTSLSGEVYASRIATTPAWATMTCASTAHMETENIALSHTNPDDNITRTFNGTTHAGFYVGTVQIVTNNCSTVNTYVSGAAQDASFEEMVLHDGTNIVYATIVENDATGFDSNTYDFQMIIPENGTAGFSSSTAYYFYVELL